LKLKRIVITGGPATGKTVIIEALEKAGFVCFHEVIRAMTKEAKQNGDAANFVSNPIVSVDDPLEFNTLILEKRLAQYNMADALNASPIFYDRGMPDVLAYMDYFNQKYDTHFIDKCNVNRYDVVFILPPWEAIYVIDNERFESYEEAVEIHRCLNHSYKELGYTPISVPKASIQDRISFILGHLNQ